MSIINQMLQDLEQRHADGVVAGDMTGQVRAVPQERKSHAAWLVAAISTILLGGVLLWLWLRPAPPVQTMPASVVAAPLPTPVPTPAPPELTLKLEPDLMVMPEVVVPATQASSETRQLAATDTIADISIVEKSAGKAGNSKPNLAVSAAPVMVNKPAAEKTKTTSDAQLSVRDSGNQTASRQVAPDKAAAPDAPAMLSKQIKELTPQQRSENDYRRATGLMQQGRIAEATSLLEQALQSDAQNAGARQTLIALLISNKRQDEAARRAQDGLNLDNKQAGFAMILARLQVEKGEQQTAINTLQRTLPYAQDRAEYQAFLAALLQREGRHKDAVEQYLAAVRKMPQNGLWWMGLGISLQAENRAAEAREAFIRARESATLTADLQAFVEQKLKQLAP
ncbi:tetratricopeptide repeat protein [Herminiimonas fonticola]|uniref:MSHA biogenesis protein MshN n=1 Tax=Herminiimonas fonticola TaxID=303380 RepID=A0A4R6GKV3_9BURK|nr:tetratricopeptide repeat protein [Herminiimonas fonticola]RBA25747.1 Tetratricopeptide [Herminiimonas fonticola]TDN94855.1 MSHA biogenesis protein MshN [Herminiimonas fonticola]